MALRDRSDIRLDTLTVSLFVFMVIFGWINIYAATGESGNGFWSDLFDLSKPQGKQTIFIIISAVLCFVTLTVDLKLVEFSAYIFYVVAIFLCVLVLFVGKEINGAKAWFSFGGFGIQPSEFAKIGTTLALARYMSRHNFTLKRLRDQLTVAAIITIPALLIILQKDTGTALVFTAFIVVLLREGMSLIIFSAMLSLIILALVSMAGVNQFILSGILVGVGSLYYLRKPLARFFSSIGFYMSFKGKTSLLPLFVIGGLIVWSVSINVVISQLKDHQQDRIKALFNPDFDPLGVNYNTTQSKIAIGSGGLWGKGFMQGTQTKYDYVPQQHTDFIFCTTGEEYGFWGTAIVIIAFFIMIAQLTYLAENCRSKFGRVLGYSVASIIFFHVLVNIAMTIGLAPVIGIPLPFYSYGGSSLMTFSVLVFLVLNYYANRVNVLSTERF